ncbi:MAG: ABC transporter substrate-binding protein [Thermoplasmata archaeon]|nr:ABC transporter substrate-binding protein [Thermoplasmata archaeon]
MSSSAQGSPGISNGSMPSTGGQGTRSRLTRRRLTALAVAVVVIAAAVVSVTVLKPSPEKVMIGVILPFEESPAGHSVEVKSALRMAMDELNAWGGIGNTRFDMAVAEVEDDPLAVAEAFDEMETAHAPLVYVTISCTFLSFIAPLAEAAEAPLIGLSSYPGATEGYQFAYRYNIPPEVEVGSTMAILESLKVTSVGVLYTESPHGCTIYDEFTEAFVAAGGSVQSQACAADVTDYSEAVANLTGNEAIFAVASCVAFPQMFEDIRESGYQGHVLASSCASSTFIWSLEAADGVYVSAPLMYKKENILARAFMEDFKRAYGIDVTHHGAVAYDIVHLVHGLLEGTEVTRSSLEHELSLGFIFTGVMGSINISPGEHDFGFAVYPAVVVEGELLYL